MAWDGMEGPLLWTTAVSCQCPSLSTAAGSRRSPALDSNSVAPGSRPGSAGGAQLGCAGVKNRGARADLGVRTLGSRPRHRQAARAGAPRPPPQRSRLPGAMGLGGVP